MVNVSFGASLNSISYTSRNTFTSIGNLLGIVLAKIHLLFEILC